MATNTVPVTIQTMSVTGSQSSILYPTVIGLFNQTAQQRINQTIANGVRKLIQIQYDSQEIPTTQMEMIGTYEIKTNERNVLSLTLENYTYVYGSAHGMTYKKSLTFDVETGKAYTLQELFKPGSDYVKVLSDMIKEQLMTLDIPLLDGFDEIRPDQDFYIADIALVIYFQLYEITPYYVGFPAFPISVFQIQDLIQENTPLEKMAVYG